MTRRETLYGAGGAALGFDLGSVSDATKAHAGTFFHTAGHEFGLTFSPSTSSGGALQHLGTGLEDVVKGTATYLESPQGAIAGAALLVVGGLALISRHQRKSSSGSANH